MENIGTNNSEVKDSRNTAMDILRIIACFMVIILHTTAEGKYDEWTSDKVFIVISECISKASVPIFFMLSGAFARNTSISKALSKALYLFMIFVVFKCLFAVWDSYYFDGEITLLNLYYERGITDLTSYRYHLWCLPDFIALTLISPILNSAYKANRYSSLYLAILFIVYGIIRPVSVPVTLFRGIRVNFINALLEGIPVSIPMSIGYYCLGKTVYYFSIDSKERIKHPKYIIMFLGIIWVVINTVTSVVSIKRSVIKGSFDYSLIGYNTVSVFLSAVILFSIFSCISAHYGSKRHPILEFIVSCALFIYLIHPFFIDIFTKAGFTSYTFNPILSVPLKACIVFIVCIPPSYVSVRLHKLLSGALTGIVKKSVTRTE